MRSALLDHGPSYSQHNQSKNHVQDYLKLLPGYQPGKSVYACCTEVVFIRGNDSNSQFLKIAVTLEADCAQVEFLGQCGANELGPEQYYNTVSHQFHFQAEGALIITLPLLDDADQAFVIFIFPPQNTEVIELEISRCQWSTHSEVDDSANAGCVVETRHFMKELTLRNTSNVTHEQH